MTQSTKTKIDHPVRMAGCLVFVIVPAPVVVPLGVYGRP